MHFEINEIWLTSFPPFRLTMEWQVGRGRRSGGKKKGVANLGKLQFFPLTKWKEKLLGGRSRENNFFFFPCVRVRGMEGGMEGGGIGSRKVGDYSGTVTAMVDLCSQIHRRDSHLLVVFISSTSLFLHLLLSLVVHYSKSVLISLHFIFLLLFHYSLTNTSQTKTTISLLL